MPIYGDKLTFKEPTAAQVPLNEQLVEVIQSHYKKSREHLFHLCMIAYGLRRNNFISNRGKRGGNAQGKEYKPAFKAWYEKNRIEEYYGTLSNFTLYAMAGRLLNYIAWQVDRKHIDQLPSSLGALYACSQLLWSQGDTTTTEKKKRFHELLIKRVKDGSGVFTTKINRHSTRKDIEALLDAESTTTKSASGKATKKFKGTDLAQILVSKDIFAFTTTGTKRGHLKLDEVIELNKQITELVQKFDGGRNRFAVETYIDKIKQQYKSAEKPDFGAAILEADKKRKSAKRTATAKK